MGDYYIGIMSGNSLDSIDAVLVRFDKGKVYLGGHAASSIDPEIKELVRNTSTLADVIKIDNYFAHQISDAVLKLVEANRDIKVAAIGSHGQTVYHDPKGEFPASLQLGNPNIIAARTGIDVIADFRGRDIAEGGEGAPLAPIFHEYFYASSSVDRFIVNIGGIANVTHLSQAAGLAAGFDTGPGNMLIDENIKLALGKDFDEGGNWARSGKLLDKKLKVMLKDPYFAASYPKSTGREYFNRAWLQQYLSDSPCDIQATLTHLTAITIADAVKSLAPSGEIVLAGGGASNTFLVELIRKYAKNYRVVSASQFGLAPELVEAVTFAYLAKLHMQKSRLNLQNVTGAKRAYQIGVHYPA